jgi:hypothetical protein
MYSFLVTFEGLFYICRFCIYIWLFHDKKKWYYFDHGILHYIIFFPFTFIDSNAILIDKGMLLFDPTPAVEWINFSKSIGFFWMIYFFLAHRLYYQQPILKSLYKSSLIILINLAANDCSCCSVCIIHI